MNKSDFLVSLGILTLLGSIIIFCQYTHEERNPTPYSIIYQAKKQNKVESLAVTMTAYSPDVAQCQGNPWETASGLIVTPQNLRKFGLVAVSRDLWEILKKEYGYKWGDDISIYVEFKVVDLMGATAQGKVIENTIDWFFEKKEDALNFGRQPDREIIILEEKDELER